MLYVYTINKRARFGAPNYARGGNMIKTNQIPEIGTFLNEEFLKPLQISQNKLSKAIKVPQNRISNIVNNITGITIDTDLRLCKYFGLSDGYFLRVQDTFEMLRTKIKLGKQLDEIKPLKREERCPSPAKCHSAYLQR